MKRLRGRKLLTYTMLMMCLMSLLTGPAAAVSNDVLVSPEAGLISPVQPPAIIPNYIGTEILTATLNISSTGYSSCTGSARLQFSYTGYVTLELQQKNGSQWDSVKIWTSSGNIITFSEGYYVLKGYDYRLKISAHVYNSEGLIVETPYVYSAVVSH